MIFFGSLPSVTRWLPVAICCAILATAQLASADEPGVSEPTRRPADLVIYPKGSAEKPAGTVDEKSSSGSRGLLLVASLLLAAAGAWVLIQRRQGTAVLSRGPRKLQVEETRPLGNRQYLIVANYDGKKFLLGVTTGQIQMLAALDAAPGEQKP